MNKEIEVLNALESDYKVKLRWKTLEINGILQSEKPHDSIEQLKIAISDYANQYSQLQMAQRIKEQFAKGHTEDEN